MNGDACCGPDGACDRCIEVFTARIRLAVLDEVEREVGRLPLFTFDREEVLDLLARLRRPNDERKTE